MKKLFLSFLLVSTTIFAASAQKIINDLNVEKRTATGYHGIEVGTGIKLILTEGPTEEVAVSASTSEFRDQIVTKVENGILKIYYENKVKSINKRKETKDLKAYVSYKTIDMLDVNTGASVKINGILKSSALNINANTGAEIKGEVSVDNLGVSQNTGSKITLTGKATKLKIEGDTGSMFKGIDLKTDVCNAKVSTGAQITVTAEKELYAKANTGGYVKYKGSASIKEISKGSGGYVSKVNN